MPKILVSYIKVYRPGLSRSYTGQCNSLNLSHDCVCRRLEVERRKSEQTEELLGIAKRQEEGR